MNLNNISFPYPVLGSFDDILPAPKDPKVKVSIGKNHFHFIIELEYANPDIEKLVEDDLADYVCEVRCEATRFLKCHKGKLLKFQIDIPRRSVSGKIEFSCTITTKRTIRNYVNRGFHPDYHGHVFAMEPGDILGIFPQFYYIPDIKYDKLKAVGTFMEIKESTTDEIPKTILENDKVELHLPSPLFKQYKFDPRIKTKAEILQSSLVMNSLVYALSQYEKFSNKKWAETIKYRIDTEKELERFKDQDPQDWATDILAQILLGNPYERLFLYLQNQQDTD